jgi:hypothetical protein
MGKMVRKFNVLKASGKYEPFSKKKVQASLRRVGVGKEPADKIIAQVEAELYDGIPTSEIYKKVFGLLKRRQPPVAVKYNLKRAVMELGPSGYPFEKFIAGVLSYGGYKTETNRVISGRCVSHEIDVVAKKDGQRCMIECKFHNKRGIRSDIKDALYVYARFLDVETSFDECWLVTNTKVTSMVSRYGECVGLKIVSWDYPKKENLFNIIDRSGLYPVTALHSIGKSGQRRLLENGFVFCRDLDEEAFALLPSKRRSAVEREIAGLP